MTTAAPSQGRTTTTSRRFSQVYVDIPPSPYRRDSLKAATVKTPSDENMPEDNGDVHTTSKRKRDGGDSGDVKEKKKVKTDKGGVKGKAAAAEKSSLEEQYPHGYFHCHQCVQKRDVRDGLQCTFRGHGGTQGRRCKLKYCKTCLKNRYGLDIDVLRQRHPNSLHGKELVEYVTDVDHVFKCPRCTKMCNCRTCRKAQGLPPTGNLTVTAKRTGADSVAAMLATNKNLTEAQAKQMDLPAPPPPAPKASSSKTATTETGPKPKRAYNRKPKPVPQPLWSPAPVPSSFTLEHGLARVHIHDFVLRFSSFFGDLTRAQLDELSEIGGRGGAVDEDDDVEDEVDVGVKLGWVSEGCLRGVLLGLLGLAVDSEEVEDDKETLRAFKAASLSVRNAGASLNKMYTALSSSNLSDILDLREPLQPPSTRGRVTRSETRTVGDIHILTSAQLIPVVERLVEVAVVSVGVKEVMDETGTKLADFAREERERRKEEKERWEGWRKANTVTKTERDAHTATLSSFTHALSIAQSAHAPRFSPLGTDNAGRVFVVAAPTATERDVASEVLTGEKSKKGGRGRSGRIVPSEDERASMKKWGWFLAVYGDIPDGAMRVRDDDESDEGEDEGEEKRWWGFYEPGEIRKVAGWIAHTNGLVEEKDKDKEQGKRASPWDSTIAKAKSASAASSSRAASSPLSSAPQSSSASRSARESLTPLSSLESDDDEDGQPSRRTATRAELEKLVQSLKDYADLLEWRVSRHDGDGQFGGGEKDAGKGKGKSAAVQPKSFYG